MLLNELNLKQAIDGLKKGEFSPQELFSACRKRIKEVEPKIKAFLTIEKYEENTKWRETALGGVPMAVKPVLSTKDKPSSASSRILENYLPPYDATVVRKLREAGAIILGSTNADAFAFGASTENSGFGPSHNPWDLQCVPGGSSGGSAAAVAADECIFALGTDTGGSIRQPASFCNVVGLKNTYGRCSRYGLMAMGSSFDTPGALTKTVEDQAFLLNIMAGHDPLDATSSGLPVPDYVAALGKGVKGLKIGLPKEYFGEGLNSEVGKAVKEAARVLESRGAILSEVSLPSAELAMAVYYVSMPSEISANMSRYTGVRFGGGRELFEPEVKRRIMLGTYALSSGYYEAYYLKSAKVRTLIINEFKEVFGKVDLLLGPVTPTTAFKLGEKANDPLQMYLADIYTCSINVAGVPAISVPCGFDSRNLPIGLQLIGPHFSEDLLLRVAYSYEQATEWHKNKPKL
jgi:aspartyl-tRNA(Asn)/glutamyl-tRNA(Gln) amidotransferase subunit A